MDTSGETPIRAARYDYGMLDFLKRLVGRATKVESLWSLSGLVTGTGVFVWLGTQWETLSSQGWAAVVIVGTTAFSGIAIALCLLILVFRRFTGERSASADTGQEVPTLAPATVPVKPVGSPQFGEPRLFNVTRDPGPNHGGPTPFACIELPILLPRGAAACTIGLVAVYARRTSDGYVGQKRLAWRFCEKRTFLPGEEARVPLVFIAHDARNHGYYGEVVGGESHIGVGTDHVLTIFVDADGASVDRKFAISVLSSQITSALAVGQIGGGNRFIFREAGEPVFDVAAVESATESLPLTRALGMPGGPFGM